MHRCQELGCRYITLLDRACAPIQKARRSEIFDQQKAAFEVLLENFWNSDSVLAEHSRDGDKGCDRLRSVSDFRVRLSVSNRWSQHKLRRVHQDQRGSVPTRYGF